MLCALASMATWSLPAGAADPPRPAQTLEEMIAQTAAVVEASVEDVQADYDEAEGPRTVTTLSRITVHIGALGSATPATIPIRSFGGALPDGREIFATHVPSFLPGKRYLVFLRNTAWTLSPVTFGLAFRLETVGDVPVLVDAQGRLVQGITERGPWTTIPLFVEPPGGGMDTATPPRLGTWVTGDMVREGLDVPRFVALLRAFMEERGVWPHGSFTPFPTMQGPAWWRVNVTPSSAISTEGDEGLLACLAEPQPFADDAPADPLTCTDGGGRP
jgi:hypothetical protein